MALSLILLAASKTLALVLQHQLQRALAVVHSQKTHGHLCAVWWHTCASAM